MASYAGISISSCTSVVAINNPRRAQTNAYGGVDGLERLDMGSAGGTVVCQAVLYGVNQSDLNSQEATWKGYQAAGTFNTLVDNQGNSYFCFLYTYEPTSKIDRAADGGYMRSVNFTFIYLS